MDRQSLKAWLDAGLSLPQIGALTDRDPSTVGYWVKKHGLEANGKAKYAPRGGIARERLTALIDDQRTLASIADELGVSQSTVCHWMRRYGLATVRKHRRPAALAALAEGKKRFFSNCRYHGVSEFGIYEGGRTRCVQCNNVQVARRRRKVKEQLIAEAGGQCVVCGYDRDPAALQFHHLDPRGKTFGIASGGCTRGIQRAREEASKCVLLCATCHAEVESGTTQLPISSGDP